MQEKCTKNNEEKLKLTSHGCLGYNFFSRRYSHDRNIFNCVFEHNEYHLPEIIDPSFVIVDIGAHIGSFSFACLTRGANNVYSYEAHPENYEIAKMNVKQFEGRCTINNAAVWRSDEDNTSDLMLFNEDLQNREDKNTGGISVIYTTSGIPVKAISLDDIISIATQEGKDKIDLLKIDCEGSEFPILLTSKHLDKVHAICGEYHELRSNVPEKAFVDGYDLPYDKHTIEKCLKSNGFKNIKMHPSGDNLGLFFADRK